MAHCGRRAITSGPLCPALRASPSAARRPQRPDPRQHPREELEKTATCTNWVRMYLEMLTTLALIVTTFLCKAVKFQLRIDRGGAHWRNDFARL